MRILLLSSLNLVIFRSGQFLILCLNGSLEIVWVPHELVIQFLIMIRLFLHTCLENGNDGNFASKKEERNIATEYH